MRNEFEKLKANSNMMVTQLNDYEKERKNRYYNIQGKKIDNKSLLDPSYKTTGEFSIDKKFLERMEDQMIVKLNKRENMLDTQDEEFEKNYPFTPAISNHSRLICEMNKQEPIYVRYQEYLEEKKQKLDIIREQNKREEKLKAKNQMIKKSRKRSKDDIERDFYKDNQNWIEKRNKKIKEQMAQKLRQEVSDPNLTFKPRINSKSKEILKYKTFHERQEHYQRKKSKKQLRTIMALPTYKFKPNLNKNSLVIAEKKRDSFMKKKDNRLSLVKNNENEEKKLDLKFSGQKTVKVNKNEFSRKGSVVFNENQFVSPKIKKFEEKTESYEIYHFNKALTQKKQSPIEESKYSNSAMKENAFFYNSATIDEEPKKSIPVERITIEEMNVSFSNKNLKSTNTIPRETVHGQDLSFSPSRKAKGNKKKKKKKNKSISPLKTVKKKRKKNGIKKKKRLSTTGNKAFTRVKGEDSKAKKRRKRTKRKIRNTYSSKTPIKLKKKPVE